MRRCIAAFALVLAICAVALAQEGDAPKLTSEQKLTLQVALQRIEIAQLRLAFAQQEFEKARGEAQQLIQGLGKKGWRLDVQTGAYVKEEEEKK